MAFFDQFTGAQQAKQAGDIQAQAALGAIPLQQAALLGAQQQLGPFAQVGQAALGSQAALAGLAGQEAQQAAIGQIQESPGQKFIRERQQRALLRNAAAIGGLGGGNVRSALQEQAAGFAIQDLENQRRQLAGLSGQGFAAGTNLGALGISSAGTIGDLQQAASAARASGIIGEQQARAGGLTDLAGVLTSIFG